MFLVFAMTKASRFLGFEVNVLVNCRVDLILCIVLRLAFVLGFLVLLSDR